MLTVINCVVSPFGDHTLPDPILENSVTSPPEQNVVGPNGVTVGAGSGLTVTVVAAEVPEQPFPSVTVTVNVPELLTVIACVVAPVDHKYPAAALDVNVTLPPWQKVVGPPAVIVGVGFGFTVTVVADEVAVHPFPSVSVTV